MNEMHGTSFGSGTPVGSPATKELRGRRIADTTDQMMQRRPHAFLPPCFTTNHAPPRCEQGAFQEEGGALSAYSPQRRELFGSSSRSMTRNTTVSTASSIDFGCE